MKKLLAKIPVLLVTVLLVTNVSIAQNAIVGTGFSTGWGVNNCVTTGNTDFKFLSAGAGTTYGVTTVANGTGNQYMRFAKDWSSTYGQYAITPGSDVLISPNTTYSLNMTCTNTGSQYINVGSTSYNYVFKTINAGTAPTGTFVFFEVQGAVRTVSSVTRNTPAQDVPTTVTATLSGALSSGQAVYLRCTNNSYSTSTVIQMTGSGTTYTANIPASINTAAASVSYYVFTSGTANVASNGSNADLYTINLNNNSGSNYTYTVPTTYYSKGNLAFQTASNWNTKRDGTGTNAANFTTSGNVFVIQGTGGGLSAPHTMTSSSTVTIGAGVTVLVENGGTLQQNSNITFGGTSNFQLNAGSFFIQNSSSASGISAGVEIWDPTATITYTNTGFISSANISGTAHPNVIVSNGSNSNFAGVITSIAGDLTMNQGTSSLTLTGATALTMTISGNLNLNTGSTFSIGNGTATPVINIGGNVNISSGITFTYNGSGAQGTINFTKSGTQTFTNAGTIASTKINYTVNSGSTLDIGTSIIGGTGTFTVSSGAGLITANTNATGALTTSGANGSIQVTGTRTFNTGANYTFNGASAQVAGNGFTGAANLTINNSAGVTLSTAAAVTGTLTLTSGKLTLGANNLTLTGATVSGASSSNYIVTNSTGSVLRSIASGGGSFTFPIGRSSSAYNPLTITNTGGTTAVYTVSTAASTYSPAADGANAQWSIAASASTTSTLAFEWATADAGANLSAAPASGQAWQYNGATWDNRTGSTTGTPNVTTVTGITSLTNPIWTVAAPAIVPDVALADNVSGQVAAGNIVRNTSNNIIYNFQAAVTTGNATLTAVAFTTTGTYSATDVTNFKLYYATTNSFGSASQIGSSITTGLGTGAHSFTVSQLINNGSTGYFWIVSDVPSGAATGVTLAVSAITTGDLTFASANKTGSTTGSGTQTIIDVPSVTTGAASAVSTTGATLNGTVSANGASTTAGFDYGTSVAYGSTASAAENPVTTQAASVSAAISSLTANTLYHFRAHATNAAGGPVNGLDATFTTISLAPVMDDITARSPNSVGFTANWSAPGAQGSETYTYTIEVDDDNAFGSVDYSNTLISSATFSDAVTGLASGTTYYYRVKAVNAGGSSAWSATSAGVTTTSAVAPTVVTGTVTASSIVVDGAEIAGNDVTSDGGDAITARGLRYNSSSPAEGAGGTTVPLGSGTTGTFDQSLSGLLANTLYYVKAYATNGVGTSYGSEVSFTTLAAEPTTASTVSFGARTNTSLVVNFTGGNGNRRFVVARAANNSFSFTPADRISLTGTIDADFTVASNQGGGDKIVYDGTGTTVTVTGLTANTAYYFAVYEYSNNSAGSPNYYLTPGTGNENTYNPTISITGSLTAFANTVAGSVSADQTYSVSGTELVSNVAVTPPAGFEVATQSDFSDAVTNPSSLSLAPTAGTLGSTTIYVRFAPASASGATGTLNITHTATDATTQNVAVSGNALDSEPTTEGSVSFGTVTGTTIEINLPTIGNGDKRLVVIKAGSAVDSDPVDGVNYTANAAFGSGTQIGTGNYVVYSGTGSGSSVVTVTGLSGATTYHVAVYEFNEGTGTSQNYLTPSTVTGNTTTLAVSSPFDAFRTYTSGNWNSAGTWESFTGGNWMAATIYPDFNAAAITVLNGHTVTVPASTSITADEVTVDAGGQITIAATGTLVLNNGTGTDLTLNGYLKNSGTFTTTGATLAISGTTATYEHNVNNLTIPAGITWSSGSTLRLNGTYTGAGTAILSAGSYQNIVWEGTISNSSDYVSIGDNVITIAGKFTASGTGSGALLTSAGGTSPTVAEYEQTSGIVFINRNSASTRSLTVTGNATISGGTLHIKTSAGAGAGQLIVGGNLNVSSGATLTNSGSAGSAALQFNGSGAQTWSNAGAFSNAIAVSTITNAGGVTLNTNLTLPSTSSLTLTAANFTIGAGNTLTVGSSATVVIGSGRTLTVNGTLVRTASTTFTTTGTLVVANGGKYQHAHTAGTVPTATWNTGSICEITGGTVPTAGMGQSFYHLYWNCATQSATINLLSSLTTINGNFEVQNTNGNIIRLSNGTLTLNIGGDLIISGAGSTVQAASSGNTATINVGGDVNIGSTATLATAGNAWSVNLGGDWTNSGTFTNANSTIQFNGTTTQTITKTGGETFRILTINKSAGTAVMANNVTVSTTLTLTAGTLSINGNTLTLSGNVTRTSGNLAGGNTSSLVANGSTGTLFFDGTGTNNYLKALTLGTGATATLGNALNITAYDGTSEGVLTVTGSGVLTTGGFLTMKSDSNGSARVAPGNTAGGYISGNVSVERYIPQNSSKAWRLLASNTTGQTINAAWQEGAVGDGVDPNPGFGTIITGRTSTFGTAATAQAAGYDTLAPGNALLKYDAATDNLVAVPNTNATSLASEQGYFLFVRGDRAAGSIDPGTPTSPTTSTVLRSKGSLFQGNQTPVATGTSGWGLVRNPYPSRIDMRNIVRSGISNTYQVWDSKLGGSYGVGGYQTFTWNGSTDYLVSPGGGSYGANNSPYNYIESGAAFFIQGSAGSTAQVVEGCKTSGSNDDSYRPVAAGQRLLFNLYSINPNSTDMVDGGLVFFENVYSNDVDLDDARKSPNFRENFGLIRNAVSLAVEKRNELSQNDTVFFDMSNMRQIQYRLDVSALNMDPLLTGAVLEDKFTGTSTALDLTALNSYTFTVNAAAASKAADRFRILFRTSNVVPVSFISVKAAQQATKIAVEWKVASQVNVVRYEIEKATDGRTFTAAGTVVASSSSVYNWDDVNVVRGYNYYRIKSVDNNGQVKYSDIVKVLVGSGKQTITVSPNPIQGNNVNIQFTEQEAGKYTVRMTNVAGQVVYSREVMHNGGNASQSFALSSLPTAGIYQLEIITPAQNRQVIKVIVNPGN